MAWIDTLQTFRNMVNALHYQGAPINSIKPEQQNPVFQKIGDALADHANDQDAHGVGGLPTGAIGSILYQIYYDTWGLLPPGNIGQQLKLHNNNSYTVPYYADSDIALDLYIEYGGYCYSYYFYNDEFTQVPYFAIKNVYLRDNSSKKKVYLQVGGLTEFNISAAGYLFINIADFIAATDGATILLRRDNQLVNNANYMLSAMDVQLADTDLDLRYVTGKLSDLGNQSQIANQEYAAVPVISNVATIDVLRKAGTIHRYLVAHNANVLIKSAVLNHPYAADGFIRVTNTHVSDAITATFTGEFESLVKSIPAQKTMLFYFCLNGNGFAVHPIISDNSLPALTNGKIWKGSAGNVPTEVDAPVKNNYAATTAPAVGNDTTQGYAVGSRWIDITNDNIYDCVDATTGTSIWIKSNFEVISYALSDYATALSTGVKDSFHVPYPCKLVELFIAVGEAPTGSILIADIKKNGTSIFTTKPSIDATEKISLTAATPYVLTGAISFIKGDEVISSIDQVGATLTGKGVKAYLIIDRR